MNKYELTVVVSAKLDDEGRTAEVEKVKALIEKFGGTITKIEEAGKKKLAYEIQKMSEAFYYFIDIGLRHEQTFDDMTSFTSFFQIEFRSSYYYILLVLEVIVEHLFEIKYSRLSGNQRKENYSAGYLHIGVLKQHV